jgi:hypothetical protein
MTLERVTSEIRDLEEAPFTDKNVYDLAMLYIVRDHMQAPAEPAPVPMAPIVIRDNSPKLTPLEQMEAAMSDLVITGADDRRKLQELREAARILNA